MDKSGVGGAARRSKSAGDGALAEPGGDSEEEDGEAQGDDRTVLDAASPLPPEAKSVDGHRGADE